jgi:hypothetical protein
VPSEPTSAVRAGAAGDLDAGFAFFALVPMAVCAGFSAAVAAFGFALVYSRAAPAILRALAR